MVYYSLAPHVDRQQYPHVLKAKGWRTSGGGQGIRGLDASYYGPSSSKAAAKAELRHWYAAQKRAGVIASFSVK
jgi:hypothetical protein